MYKLETTTQRTSIMKYENGELKLIDELGLQNNCYYSNSDADSDITPPTHISIPTVLSKMIPTQARFY